MNNTDTACTGPRRSNLDRCGSCVPCRIAAELRDHAMRVRLYGAEKARPYTLSLVPADLRAAVKAAL